MLKITPGWVDQDTAPGAGRNERRRPGPASGSAANKRAKGHPMLRTRLLHTTVAASVLLAGISASIAPVGADSTAPSNDAFGGALALPEGRDSALLCSRTGHRLTYQFVITLFQRVRSEADIRGPNGEPRPPRLHDLRHTAAVHRVLGWYRAGKDVQRLLPQLATYLGHVDITSTQRYLQMTPELLQEAGRRFAAYAQQESDHA